ncbi:MAG TPA: DMT family protein [Thermoanaerobaculia bacterium]|nr:DMT family protein [Thermoanaerobaculia bacterium]
MKSPQKPNISAPVVPYAPMRTIMAALVSWGVALFEDLVQVPANRRT